MKPIPEYRVSIYSTNFLFIVLLSIEWCLIYSLSQEARLAYFGLNPYDPMFMVFVGATALQILVCFGGVLSVFCSWRNAIRIHWLMMIPLVLMDLTVIGLNAARIQTLHRNMEQLIAEKSVSLGGLNTCPDWMGMRQEWMCCPPSVVVHVCQRAEPLNWTRVEACTGKNPKTCTIPLLRWLHTRTDRLLWLLVFGLLPLKLFIFFVLREDIQELFTEIVYNDNQQLYRGAGSNQTTVQSFVKPKRPTIMRQV